MHFFADFTFCHLQQPVVSQLSLAPTENLERKAGIRLQQVGDLEVLFVHSKWRRERRYIQLFAWLPRSQPLHIQLLSGLLRCRRTTTTDFDIILFSIWLLKVLHASEHSYNDNYRLGGDLCTFLLYSGGVLCLIIKGHNDECEQDPCSRPGCTQSRKIRWVNWVRISMVIGLHTLICKYKCRVQLHTIFIL